MLEADSIARRYDLADSAVRLLIPQLVDFARRLVAEEEYAAAGDGVWHW
jgi:hypothetical protein